MLEFYQTRGGRQFIDATVPQLVEQVSKLNDNLERLIAVLKQSNRIEQKAEKQ